MNEILATWYLPALAVLTICGVGLAGTFLLDRTLARLNGVITSPSDLGLLRRAINLNMKMAVLIMALFFAYCGALFWYYLGGRIGFDVVTLYLIASGLPAFACSKLYIKKVEERAKNLLVRGEDAEMTAAYRSFIEQWGKLGLSVS